MLLESFAHCREHKGLLIHAWVILDNHFHATVAGLELAQTVRDLKKFTARGILAQLPLEGRDWLVNQFACFRAAHKRESAHQAWQEGFHPQANKE